MSIEGVGKPTSFMRSVQRAAPMAAGLTTASCDGEITGLTVAFLALVTFALYPKDVGTFAASAGRWAAAPFRSILARTTASLAAKRAPHLPSLDSVYVDGFTDREWATFCHEDLLRKGAGGSEFKAHSILNRYGIAWNKFVEHTRPFKSGGGSLTTHDVREIVKEFGLSDEAAYRASVAWAVRATGKKLDVNSVQRASNFFGLLATVAGVPPSISETECSGIYTPQLAPLIGNFSRFIASGLPHTAAVLSAELSLYYQRSIESTPLAERHRAFAMETNRDYMSSALDINFRLQDGWTGLQHEDSVANTRTWDLNPFADRSEAHLLRALHYLGQSMSYAASADIHGAQSPELAREALIKTLSSINRAAPMLFSESCYEDDALTAHGLPIIARFAAETVYGRAYLCLRRERPAQGISATPRRMVEFCHPHGAPANVFRGLMKI